MNTPASITIVVLGFAHRHSEASNLRVSHGVSLYKSLSHSHTCWLILTGGDTASVGCTEAEHMKAMAISEGVPEGRVLTEDKARYTIENAIFVRRIVEDIGGVGEVKIVTNEFHAKRSHLIFQVRRKAECVCLVLLREVKPTLRNVRTPNPISHPSSSSSSS